MPSSISSWPSPQAWFLVCRQERAADSSSKAGLIRRRPRRHAAARRFPVVHAIRGMRRCGQVPLLLRTKCGATSEIGPTDRYASLRHFCRGRPSLFGCRLFNGCRGGNRPSPIWPHSASSLVRMALLSSGLRLFFRVRSCGRFIALKIGAATADF
jgi:hypothetical protein